MFSFLIIILTKNHDLSLILDNHCQITEHLIDQLNQLSLQLQAHWIQQHQLLLYNCEHIDYLTMSVQFISQACQLFSNINLFSHAQFSWLNFFDSNFLTHFSVIFLFDWSHSHVWDFDQIYYHKQLFYFVLCFFWEVFCLLCFSSCFVFLFEISVKSISMSWYLISCSIFRKDLCLHSQIFNSEAQISLTFVYNTWKWISQTSLAKTQ